MVDQLHVHAEIKKDQRTTELTKANLGYVDSLHYCITVQIDNVNFLFSNFKICKFPVQKNSLLRPSLVFNQPFELEVSKSLLICYIIIPDRKSKKTNKILLETSVGLSL